MKILIIALPYYLTSLCFIVPIPDLSDVFS